MPDRTDAPYCTPLVLLMSTMAVDIHLHFFRRNRTPRDIPYGEIFKFIRGRLQYIRTKYLIFGLHNGDASDIMCLEIMMFDRLFFLGPLDPIGLIQGNDMLIQRLELVLHSLDTYEPETQN